MISPRTEGAAIILILGTVLAVSSILDAAPRIGPGLCIFKNITGLPCPSCGMTRAFIFLGHGNISSAIALNPSSIFIYGAVWLGLMLGTLQVISQKQLIKIAWTNSRKVLFPGMILLMSLVWLYKLCSYFTGAVV